MRSSLSFLLLALPHATLAFSTPPALALTFQASSSARIGSQGARMDELISAAQIIQDLAEYEAELQAQASLATSAFATASAGAVLAGVRAAITGSQLAREREQLARERADAVTPPSPGRRAFLNSAAAGVAGAMFGAAIPRERPASETPRDATDAALVTKLQRSEKERAEAVAALDAMAKAQKAGATPPWVLPTALRDALPSELSASLERLAASAQSSSGYTLAGVLGLVAVTVERLGASRPTTVPPLQSWSVGWQSAPRGKGAF